MCLDFLIPKAPTIAIPTAPPAPPPPQLAPEVQPAELGGSSKAPRRRLGKRRLQIPLVPTGSAGVQTP